MAGLEGGSGVGKRQWPWRIATVARKRASERESVCVVGGQRSLRDAVLTVWRSESLDSDGCKSEC